MTAFMPSSCNNIPEEERKGTLMWNFSDDFATRSAMEIPDTDSFNLEVIDANGNSIYKGKFGDSPSCISVEPGSYTVRALSCDFSAPEFDAPQFGDEQVAVVNSGSVTRVELNCAQLNSGLRLVFDDDFKSRYSGGRVRLSATEGSIDYVYSESRTAFFRPGKIRALLDYGGSSMPMMARQLEPSDMLTIRVSCSSGSVNPSGGTGASLSIMVDTSRTWLDESYVMGQEDSESGSSASSAYSVAQARSHVGEKGVWVTGYIVGGDLSAKEDGISFEPPFNAKTNMAIATRSSVKTKSSCLSVQLSKAAVRSALNLVDNPELIGKKVFLKGNIVESYFGLVGIQGITEYSIK